MFVLCRLNYKEDKEGGEKDPSQNKVVLQITAG